MAVLRYIPTPFFYLFVTFWKFIELNPSALAGYDAYRDRRLQELAMRAIEAANHASTQFGRQIGYVMNQGLLRELYRNVSLDADAKANGVALGFSMGAIDFIQNDITVGRWTCARKKLHFRFGVERQSTYVCDSVEEAIRYTLHLIADARLS